MYGQEAMRMEHESLGLTPVEFIHSSISYR